MDTTILQSLAFQVKDAVQDILYGHLTRDKPTDLPLDVMFMAGSPAAGKTELLTRLIDEHGLNDFVRIDADDIRWWFPYYNEENSFYYQKPASDMVDYIYKKALTDKHQIIMDSTFASKNYAEQNFDAALAAGYEIILNYVYLDPEIAWQYASKRKRAVPLDVLKRNFINGRKVIKHMLDKYDGQFTLNVYHRFTSSSDPTGFDVEETFNVTRSTWEASHPCSYTHVDELSHIGV